MEGALNNTNSLDLEKEHKMEIETSFESNHSDAVNNYILNKRMKNPFLINKNPFETRNLKSSASSDLNDFNIDIIKYMEEVISLLNDLSNKKNIPIFNMNSSNIEKTKNILLQNLKKIRKELSKETIPVTKVKKILNNNIQYFIEKLIESLNDINDDNIQMESLWIANNLIFFISKYDDDINFGSIKIAKLLNDYLIKIQNEESNKYALIEKIYRIFGNLIYLNRQNITLLCHEQLLDSVINNLNSPVQSFRNTCLWLLNKIFISLRKTYPTNYIKQFINKNAISNYNLVFSRIKKHVNFDDISEFYWLMTELAKHDSSILIPIFLSNVDDTHIFAKKGIIKNEFALNNFSFILDNSLTNKMSQVSFRLISDLLVVCNKDFKNEFLLTKFIECFFEKKSVLLYINDVLSSPKNKYDISLVRDILLLIFNLMCLSLTKSCIFFKKGIVNLICDRDYHANKDIMKLLYMIFYRILLSSSFSFEPNDEKVIKTCLSYIKRVRDDENTLSIFIDILYLYLKSTKTNIDSEFENEFQLFRADQNLNIEKYLYIFSKLANIVKMSSPISKSMRNL